MGLLGFLQAMVSAVRPTRVDGLTLHATPTNPPVVSVGVVDSTGATRYTTLGTGSGTVGGAGSPDQLARWTAASTLADSQIYDDGSYIGINAATGLNLSGDQTVFVSSTSAGIQILPSTTLTVTAPWGVTIGTTSAGISISSGTTASLAATTTMAVTGGTGVTVTATNGTALFQSTAGSSSLTMKNIGNVTLQTTANGGVGLVLIASGTGGAICTVSAPDSAGKVLINAGGAAVAPAAGVAKLRGNSGVTIEATTNNATITAGTAVTLNGIPFLGVYAVGSLPAGASIAIAYATGLHRLTVAGPWGTQEGGGGTGGLVERSAAGNWYLPGTLIPAT